MITTQLPTLITVITTAAIDAINPCAIGVMILMISAVLVAGQSTARLIWLGLTYVFGVFLAYLLGGLGLLYFLGKIPLYVTEYLSLSVASLIIFAGILEMKDYFWYGQGWSLHIPVAISKKLTGMATNVATSTMGVFFLGIFVSAVELPCTGAPYLAIITLLSQQWDGTAFGMLVIYNFIFVSPLLIILGLVVSGVELQKVKAFKQEMRGPARLMIGILLVALGWLLIFIANGIINFG